MIKTIKNYIDGFLNYRIWHGLASQDIKLKYRRSTLGPFWITLSMAITVSAMGPLYGSLFGISLNDFVPNLGLGLIFWAFIAASMTDYSEAFTSSEHLLKQTYIPLTTLIFRVYYRQVLILLHNLIIYPFIVFFCSIELSWNILYFIPGFVLTSFVAINLGLMIAIFCTRYRDMMPIIQSCITLLFFVTPIIWSKNQLPENRVYLANLNPFSALINVLREPLLGSQPELHSWYMGFIMLLLTSFITLLAFHVSRKKLTYWL